MESVDHFDLAKKIARESEIEVFDEEIAQMVDKFNKLSAMVLRSSKDAKPLDPKEFFQNQVKLEIEKRKKIENIKQMILIVNSLYLLIYPDKKPHYYFDDSTPEETQKSFSILFRSVKRYGGKTIEKFFAKVIARFKIIFDKFKCQATEILGQECIFYTRDDKLNLVFIRRKIKTITVNGFIVFEDLNGIVKPNLVFRTTDDLEAAYPNEKYTEIGKEEYLRIKNIEG
ncbi:hypothetical protein GF369_01790 [Candidatus Peregrinibacteria bacterium]|nr:hypothetical protein [Candidatus Peregrinibacteria bacterium]